MYPKLSREKNQKYKIKDEETERAMLEQRVQYGHAYKYIAIMFGVSKPTAMRVIKKYLDPEWWEDYQSKHRTRESRRYNNLPKGVIAEKSLKKYYNLKEREPEHVHKMGVAQSLARKNKRQKNLPKQN